MLPLNNPPEREGNYLHFGVREIELFNGYHLNHVAELLERPNKNLDGVCFMVGSSVEYGKYYKVYIPFVHDQSAPKMVSQIQLSVKEAIVDMMGQLKGQMKLH